MRNRLLLTVFVPAVLMFTGTSEAFELSVLPHYNSGDGTYTTTTREGQTVWIPNSYLYFRADGFPASVQSAYLEITYYDEPEGPRMKVQYDSDSAAYTMSNYHTRSSGEGTDTFVKSYHRLDNPGFTNRQNGGSDFRINGGGFPIKSMVVRDAPFDDPYAAYALSHNSPWLSPYSGPSRDDVNADTLKGKVMTGYQGWFKTPNDLYDEGWVHWGFDGIGNSTVDMWPDPAHYDPSSLHPVPNVITESGAQGYVFSSADPAAVQKHFEWMRKYNIDGAYLQRFVSRSRSGYYGYPEWVLDNVRAAANKEGRIWAIEYDISSLSNEADPFEVITNDWNFLVNDCHILDDPRYAHEDGKPVLFIWGFSVPDREVTLENADAILDWFGTQDLYLIGGVHSSWESMTSWYGHYQKYDQILAWMERSQSDLISQKNKLNSWGMKILPHAWPGFSWHNLKQYVFPRSYTDRAGGGFYWDKIYKAVNIGADQIFLGMFDEYDEGTAIMPMSDDPPVVPYPNIPNEAGEDNWGYYITNDGMLDDWWLTLSGHAKEMLCDQISLTSSLPSEASLDNRSNIGLELSVDLGTTNYSDLLVQEDGGDGATVGDVIAGVTCRRATQNYMYFDVDNTVLNQVSAGEDVTIIVDYYDTSDAVDIGLQYDSVSDQWKTHPKSFTTSGSDQWQTVRFEIDDAYFGDRENGADFRLRSTDAAHNMNIARVRVILTESSIYATTVPNVVGQAQATAEGNIVAAGLVVGTVTTAYSNSVPVGEVLIQSPTGGSFAAFGSSVDLVVSTDSACAGLADLNCDLIVDVSDLSYMASVWLTNDATADISQPADDIVNLLDFSVMVQVLRDWIGDDSEAHWRLDDAVGTVAADASPNAYDGTLMNMNDNDWVLGNTGNALDFDGLDNYVEITGYQGVLGSQSRTVTAWIKTAGTGAIVSWGDSDISGGWWLFRIEDAGRLRLQTQGGSIVGSTDLRGTAWHHVAAVLADDGSPNNAEVKLYVDGVEETYSSITSQSINTASHSNVTIGACYVHDGTVVVPFTGLIDDVRIYDRALSKMEIELLAQ